MYWCEAWCCQETGRCFTGSLPFSEDTTLSSILRFVSRLPHVCIDSRSELVLYYLSRSWQHRVVICVLEASFGRQSCTPNTMSCPNELTRRWTFDEHVSSGYFHFPVKKVARNTLTSSGRFISSSVSSEGLGGHDISISLQIWLSEVLEQLVGCHLLMMLDLRTADAVIALLL